MVSPVLLQKDHSDLPDHYGIKFWYITGGEETFEVANHFPITKDYFEFWSKDNKLNLIPLSSIKRLEFDKEFSKIVEIDNQIKKGKNESKNDTA